MNIGEYKGSKGPNYFRILAHFPCSHPESHVILPKELAKTLPKSRLLTESEWRGIGVQQIANGETR